MTLRADKILDPASSGVDVDGVTIRDSLVRTRFSWELSASAAQSITTGAVRTVTFSTTQWDTYPGGIADLANNRVTVPVTGKYYCSFKSTIDDININLKCYFFVNTTIVRNAFFHTRVLTNSTWGGYDCIIEASAGDHISVGVQSYVGGVVIGNFSSNLWLRTRFQGYFIGE